MSYIQNQLLLKCVHKMRSLPWIFGKHFHWFFFWCVFGAAVQRFHWILFVYYYFFFFFKWIFLLFKYVFMYLWVFVFVFRNTQNGNTLAFNSKRILFSFPRFRSRILMLFCFFFWVYFELGANLIDNNNTNRVVDAPVPELQHFRRDSRQR